MTDKWIEVTDPDEINSLTGEERYSPDDGWVEVTDPGEIDFFKEGPLKRLPERSRVSPPEVLTRPPEPYTPPVPPRPQVADIDLEKIVPPLRDDRETKLDMGMFGNEFLRSAGPQTLDLMAEGLMVEYDRTGDDFWLEMAKSLKQASRQAGATLPARTSPDQFTEAWSQGKTLDWLKESLGAGLGSSAPSIATGALGAMMAGGMAPGKAGKIKKYLRRIGGAAGAFAPNYVMQLGEARKALREEGIEVSKRSPIAHKVALATAALDTAVPERVLSGLTGAAKKEIKRNIVKRIIREAAIQTGMEGGTEAAQGAITTGTAQIAAGKEPDYKGIALQAFNDFMAGALPGTATGAMTGAVPQGKPQDDKTKRGPAAQPSPQQAGQTPPPRKPPPDLGVPGTPPEQTQTKPETQPPADSRPDLSKMGYTPEDLARMSPEEVQAAESEAVAAGVPRRGDGSKRSPRRVQTAQDLEEVGRQVNQEPTEAQKSAGTYRKGHMRLAAIPKRKVAIETPSGAIRRGRDEKGQDYESRMPEGVSYGYVARSEGKDGDKVDVFVGPNPQSQRVWVLDQAKPGKVKSDEVKILAGFDSEQAARQAYTDSYSDGSGASRIISVTETTPQQLDAFLSEGNPRNRFSNQPKYHAAPPSGQVEGLEKGFRHDQRATDWGVPLSDFFTRTNTKPEHFNREDLDIVKSIVDNDPKADVDTTMRHIARRLTEEELQHVPEEDRVHIPQEFINAGRPEETGTAAPQGAAPETPGPASARPRREHGPDRAETGEAVRPSRQEGQDTTGEAAVSEDRQPVQGARPTRAQQSQGARDRGANADRQSAERVQGRQPAKGTGLKQSYTADEEGRVRLPDGTEVFGLEPGETYEHPQRAPHKPTAEERERDNPLKDYTPVDKFEPQEGSLAKQAKDYVIREGKRLGREVLLGFNKDGTKVVDGHGVEHSVSIGPAYDLLFDPQNQITFHHNHPNDSSFSDADITLLAWPGTHSVWAYGEKTGHDNRVSLTQKFKNLFDHYARLPDFRGTPPLNIRFALVTHAVDGAISSAIGYLRAGVVQGHISPSENVDLLGSQIMNQILHLAGVTDYMSNAPDPYGFAEHPFIQETAKALSEGLFNHGLLPRTTRLLSHPGDVGGAFKQGEGHAQKQPHARRAPAGRQGQSRRGQGWDVASEGKRLDLDWEASQDFRPENFTVLREDEFRAPVFYSGVRKAVQDSKQNKAPSTQWWATISKAPGVSKKELEFMGLQGFLFGRDKPVTKDEIIQFIDAHDITIKEVMRGDKTKSQTEAQTAHDRALQEIARIEGVHWWTAREEEGDITDVDEEVERRMDDYDHTGNVSINVRDWEMEEANDDYLWEEVDNYYEGSVAEDRFGDYDISSFYEEAAARINNARITEAQRARQEGQQELPIGEEPPSVEEVDANDLWERDLKGELEDDEEEIISALDDEEGEHHNERDNWDWNRLRQEAYDRALEAYNESDDSPQNARIDVERPNGNNLTFWASNRYSETEIHTNNGDEVYSGRYLDDPQIEQKIWDWLLENDAVEDEESLRERLTETVQEEYDEQQQRREEEAEEAARRFETEGLDMPVEEREELQTLQGPGEAPRLEWERQPDRPEDRNLPAPNNLPTVLPRQTPSASSKWASYTLPGGDNYTELLLILDQPPAQRKQFTSIEEAIPWVRQHWDLHGGDYDRDERIRVFINNTYGNQGDDEAQLRDINAEHARTLGDGNYQSGHWNEKNVLMHLRFKDREDENGKRVLFVEEAQSDWHQQGRQYGYKNADSETQYNEVVKLLRAAEQKVDRRKQELIREHTGFDSWDAYYAWFHRKLQDMRARHQTETASYREVEENWANDPERKELVREFERRRELLFGPDGVGGLQRDDEGLKSLVEEVKILQEQKEELTPYRQVPDAPFKMEWTEMAIKRLIRYAADHGYDRVSWAPGTVHSQRWGTEAIWYKKAKQDYRPDGGREGWRVVAESHTSRVNNVLSKAESAVNSSYGPDVFSEEDLWSKVKSVLVQHHSLAQAKKLAKRLWEKMQTSNVGGMLPRQEGLETYYGDIWRTTAGKVVKKLSGKVDTSKFEGPKGIAQASSLRKRMWDDKVPEESLDDGGRLIADGFDITDEMKVSSVRKGFAKFSQAAFRDYGSTPKPRDWESNLNPDRIESAQDVKDMLAEISKQAEHFVDERRGRVSNNETAMLAQELGMSEDELIKGRKRGEAFNAHEAYAARQLLISSAERLRDLAQEAIQSPNTYNLAEFTKAFTRHVAIQEQVAGLTAEAGRALQQFKMMAGSTYVAAARQAMQNMASRKSLVSKDGQLMLTGEAATIDVARMVASYNDQGALNQFSRKAFKVTFLDKVRELWINGLLSGPRTQIVNTLGNTLTMIWQVPEAAGSWAIGAITRSPDRVTAKEVAARFMGLVEGTGEALSAAAHAFRTEQPGATRKVDSPRMQAIGGRTGKIVRMPTRLMGATDEFFWMMSYRAEINASAVRLAISEGHTGQALAQRIAQLKADPTPRMQKKAREHALEMTFQKDLGPIMGALMRARETSKIGWIAVPFMKTPTNIVKYALERTPFGLLMRDVQKNLAAGGRARDEQMARLALGWGVMAGAVAMTAAGMLTGPGPDDPEEKQLWLKDHQPYSVKIGDTWYSFMRMEPMSTIVGIASGLYESTDRMAKEEEVTASKIFAMAVTAISKNVLDRTWMTNLADGIDAVRNPERYGSSWVNRQVKSLVPNIVGSAVPAVDPVLRDAEGLLNQLKSRVPGKSQELPSRRDLFGEEIKLGEGGATAYFNPFFSKKDTNDKVTDEMLRLGVGKKMPSREINGHRLTPEQYNELTEIGGKWIKQQLDSEIKGATWAKRGREEQKDIISDKFRDGRRYAKIQLLRKYPALQEKKE